MRLHHLQTQAVSLIERAESAEREAAAKAVEAVAAAAAKAELERQLQRAWESIAKERSRADAAAIHVAVDPECAEGSSEIAAKDHAWCLHCVCAKKRAATAEREAAALRSEVSRLRKILGGSRCYEAAQASRGMPSAPASPPWAPARTPRESCMPLMHVEADSKSVRADIAGESNSSRAAMRCLGPVVSTCIEASDGDASATLDVSADAPPSQPAAAANAQAPSIRTQPSLTLPSKAPSISGPATRSCTPEPSDPTTAVAMMPSSTARNEAALERSVQPPARCMHSETMGAPWRSRSGSRAPQTTAAATTPQARAPPPQRQEVGLKDMHMTTACANPQAAPPALAKLPPTPKNLHTGLADIHHVVQGPSPAPSEQPLHSESEVPQRKRRRITVKQRSTPSHSKRLRDTNTPPVLFPPPPAAPPTPGPEWLSVAASQSAPCLPQQVGPAQLVGDAAEAPSAVTKPTARPGTCCTPSNIVAPTRAASAELASAVAPQHAHAVPAPIATSNAPAATTPCPTPAATPASMATNAAKRGPTGPMAAAKPRRHIRKHTLPMGHHHRSEAAGTTVTQCDHCGKSGAKGTDEVGGEAGAGAHCTASAAAHEDAGACTGLPARRATPIAAGVPAAFEQILAVTSKAPPSSMAKRRRRGDRKPLELSPPPQESLLPEVFRPQAVSVASLENKVNASGDRDPMQSARGEGDGCGHEHCSRASFVPDDDVRPRLPVLQRQLHQPFIGDAAQDCTGVGAGRDAMREMTVKHVDAASLAVTADELPTSATDLVSEAQVC